MITSNLLAGVGIGAGLAVVYRIIETMIFCNICGKEGGKCENKCSWWIFCRWICVKDPAPATKA